MSSYALADRSETIVYEAWARNAVAFIRSKGLEVEFSDWCGGWPVPVAGTEEMLAAAPEMYAVLYEMFCEGPVDVAFAGNPKAIAALDARIRAAIDKATTASSVGTDGRAVDGSEQ